MPTVSVAVEDILIRPAVTVPSPTHEEEKKEFVSDSIPVTSPVIKTESSLRDKLAVLLGQKSSIAPNLTEQITPSSNNVLSSKSEKLVTDKHDDDSGLYSMNNFGV